MLLQVAGFALLAAVSPAALLVMTVFLGSGSPRETALAYVAGAFVMTTAMAVTFLLVLRAAGLGDPRQHDPRDGLRLGLGVLALAVCAFLIQRGRRAEARASRGAARRPGLLARFTARPRPRTAFLAGLLLFFPTTTFIAAIQVVATAKAGVPVTVAGVAIVVVCAATLAWLPLVAYLAAPDATTRVLATANGWLSAHGRAVLVGALAVAGIALVVDGALGLSQR